MRRDYDTSIKPYVSPTNSAMQWAWGAMEAEPYLYKGLCEQVVRVVEEGLPTAWEIAKWFVIFATSNMLCLAYLKLGRLEDTKRVLNRALKESQARSPSPFQMANLRITAAHVMKSEPGFSCEAFGQKLPFRDSTMRNRFIDTLKQAGFP